MFLNDLFIQINDLFIDESGITVKSDDFIWN